MPQFQILCSTALKSSIPQITTIWAEPLDITPQIDLATSMAMKDRLNAGEKNDLLIMTEDGIEELVQLGLLTSPSPSFIQCGIGVAIAPNHPPVAIDTLTNFIQSLRDIPSITFTSKGVSGIYFAKVLNDLGLTQFITQKATILEGGLVANLLLNGKAAMAVQMISELRAVPLAQYLGPLPAEIQHWTRFSAGVCNASTQPTLANEFMVFLKSTVAQSIFYEAGLDSVK